MRAGKLLGKAKRPRAKRVLLTGQVCPPQMFVALHDLLLEDAAVFHVGAFW